MAGVGAGILSPSTLNLFVGKAFVQFQRTQPAAIADVAAVHLGLLSDIEYTPDVPIAKFISESGGIAYVAAAVPIQYGGRGKITLNELTMYNLGLLFQGNPNYATPASPTTQIYGLQAALTGILTITMTNGSGPRDQIIMTNVLMTPSDAFKPISKEFGSLALSFEHLADQNQQFGTITQLADVNSVSPTNYTAPFITGPTSSSSPAVPAGGTPAASPHGTALFCNSGQWTAGVGASFAFQWYTNVSNANTGGTIISGATNQSYTPISGQIGDFLYCTVAVTNTVGTTTVPSGTTQAVT